jgi:CheY-like chemotaxis protein
MTARNCDIFTAARNALSGKRIALVGFSAEANGELAARIIEADGFTRALSIQVHPSSDLLKPFELILVDAGAAAGTAWLAPDELAGVADRCIAVGAAATLLRVAAGPSHTEPNHAGPSHAWPSPPFREYATDQTSADDILFRCVLALLPRSQAPTGRMLPTGSTVVLADDDTSVTSIVRRALERNGMTCEVAATGYDALALITRLKPCAAILDVNMPTIDGFEVLARMKNERELTHTRVILLTGSEQESDVIRGFTLGADDYVAKPFNPMELTIRLMRAIGRI